MTETFPDAITRKTGFSSKARLQTRGRPGTGGDRHSNSACADNADSGNAYEQTAQSVAAMPANKLAFNIAHSGLRVVQLRYDQPKNRAGKVPRSRTLVIDRFDEFIDMS